MKPNLNALIQSTTPQAREAIADAVGHRAPEAVKLLCFWFCSRHRSPRNVELEPHDLNFLTGEFIRRFCNDDGSIDWTAVEIAAVNITAVNA